MDTRYYNSDHPTGTITQPPKGGWPVEPDIKKQMNKIEPGTPVRYKGDGGGSNNGVHYYIGLCRSGRHVVESAGMLLSYWSHVEPLPRELKKGDPVAVGYRNSVPYSINPSWVFDGMYGEYFVCIREDAHLALFKRAIHLDDYNE